MYSAEAKRIENYQECLMVAKKNKAVPVCYISSYCSANPIRVQEN